MLININITLIFFHYRNKLLNIGEFYNKSVIKKTFICAF